MNNATPPPPPKRTRWPVSPTSPRWYGRRISASLDRYYQRRQWATSLAYLAAHSTKGTWKREKPKRPNLLKLVRQAYGQSIRQVSAKTGISLARLSRIENDFLEPPFDDMYKLALSTLGSCEMLFCYGRYRDPRLALDVMAGFHPFQRAPIRKMLQMLRRQLDRAYLSVTPPSSASPGG